MLITMNTNLLSIFEYVDYRFFLRDYYAWHKSKIRGLTYRSFGQKAGFSPSLLKDIINGRQNLTLKTMLKYAEAMSLTKTELAYFEALVGFTNSTKNQEKNGFLTQLMQLRGRSPVHFLDARQYEFFSRWYYPVVREMMTRKEFGDNAMAMANAIVPKITPAKVKKAIEVLISLELVKKEPDGTWRSTNSVVSSEYQIQSVALKNYHTEMLGCAKNALESFESSEREFQGMTLKTSRETYIRLKDRIRTFSDEILATVANEKGNADVVFQLNVQMFPFTREVGGK
jgi:uncharacterized protein (TIGR02147 family)